MCSAASPPAGSCLSPECLALWSSLHPAERRGLVPAAAQAQTPTDTSASIFIFRYFNKVNKLQELLMSSSLLAVLVQLNSAFYHATAAYMHRRKDMIQQLRQLANQWRYQPYIDW